MDDKNKPYLKGQLLVAMPGMGDPRFNKAVIFICVHDEKGGMGLVINHPVPGMDFESLLEQLKLASGTSLPLYVQSMPVLTGGPVETAKGFLLHSKDFKCSDTIEIDDDFSVTGTVDGLKQITAGDIPAKMLFTLGYAGWSPGQLDQELQDNVWLTVPASTDVVFDSQPDEMWLKAIHKLGIDPAMLSGEAGRA